MTDAAAPRKIPAKKRGQGRPAPSEDDDGRERLVNATEKLLRTMPPARVTVARIVEEANVDRALVRYYFGNRTALLVAVVDRVTAHTALMERKDEPDIALADHIGKTVGFVRSAPFMHRLMIDELVQAGTDETRAIVRDMNLDLVQYYRDLLADDDGKEFVQTDPILLHLAILGVCDFFASAAPVIREILPDGKAVEKLSADFKPFLIDLLMNGLRKRR